MTDEIIRYNDTDAAAGQISRSAADVYEEFFVPALFGQWGPRLAEAAGVGPGDAVLDVACGTGAAARAAAVLGGRVTGLDRNDGMLSVARRVAPAIDWQTGRAEALPFADGAFDAVLCQFGLMFFDDRAAALAEMWRVLKPGGRLAAAVWDAAENSPGYAAMIALIDRLFGARTANALRAPFVLGNRAELTECFAAAGISRTRIETVAGTARFASIEDWVTTDVRGWTLAGMIDDLGFEALLEAARSDLAHLAAADGAVGFAAPAHVAIAIRH